MHSGLLKPACQVESIEGLALIHRLKNSLGFSRRSLQQLTTCATMKEKNTYSSLNVSCRRSWGIPGNWPNGTTFAQWIWVPAVQRHRMQTPSFPISSRRSHLPLQIPLSPSLLEPTKVLQMMMMFVRFWPMTLLSRLLRLLVEHRDRLIPRQDGVQRYPKCVLYWSLSAAQIIDLRTPILSC